MHSLLRSIKSVFTRHQKSVMPEASGPRQICAERYALIKELGQGSFGSVSLMKDRRSGQVVATKTIRNDKPYRGRAPEARIFKDLLQPHPRITELLACFLDRVPGSSQVLIFEYCDGGDLFDLISKYTQRQAIIPESFLWQVAIHITEALAYLHYGARGSLVPPASTWTSIVHCDLKPENLLLKWKPGFSRKKIYPDVVLADFGVAQISSDRNGYNAGTLLYWPPEKLKNSKKADVWGLGAVLHTAAHGFPPVKDLPRRYTDNRENQDWWNKQSESREVICFSPRYSVALDKIAQDMLQINPAKRESSLWLDRLLKGVGRKIREKLFEPFPSWAFD